MPGDTGSIPPKPPVSVDVSPGAEKQQTEPLQVQPSIPRVTPSIGGGSLMQRRMKKKGITQPKLSPIPQASPSPVKTEPLTLNERVFDRIKPNDGATRKVQQAGDLPIYTLADKHSSLRGHQMPSVIEVNDYWNFVRAENIPMIVQLETNGVSYLQDPPAAKNRNPDVISAPLQITDLAITTGNGLQIADGVMKYPVTMTSKTSENKTEIMRVVWPDEGAIPAQMLKTIVEQVPNGAAVHCQQGKGRTGTLAVAHQMLGADKRGKLNKDNVVSYISRAISDGRHQRDSKFFVQSQAQFDSLIELGKLLTSATEEDIKQQMSEVLKPSS